MRKRFFTHYNYRDQFTSIYTKELLWKKTGGSLIDMLHCLLDKLHMSLSKEKVNGEDMKNLLNQTGNPFSSHIRKIF